MQELWLPVVGYEGLYEVSDQGRVKSLPRPRAQGGRLKERILKQPTNASGYHQVSLWKDKKQTVRYVHRLVGEAFLGPLPCGLVTRHGPDGIDDNSVHNISYGTQTENSLDKTRDGTQLQGETHHQCRITAETVSTIRGLASTSTHQSIADRFGLSRQHVTDIVSRRRWAHLP